MMTMINTLRQNKQTIKCVLFTIITVIIIFRYILYLGYVPSDSMEPAINAGDIVVGSRIIQDISYDDILIFQISEYALVKRVAAKEDDVIEYQQQRLIINGKDEGGCAPEKTEEKFVVEQNHYYMLGDNRRSSNDSRYWEIPCIERKRVLAKVMLVIPT